MKRLFNKLSGIVLICVIFSGLALVTPIAAAYNSYAAYDAYDYYPGAACNDVYGDPNTGGGVLPVGQALGEDFVCPIIRIYPRGISNLSFVIFEIDVKTVPSQIKVCTRKDITQAVCATKQVFNKGKQEITFESSDLQDIRNPDEGFTWDNYIYAVVRLYPRDTLHGFRVYWDGIY